MKVSSPNVSTNRFGNQPFFQDLMINPSVFLAAPADQRPAAA